MNNEKKKNTKLKKLDLSVTVALIIGILVVVNFLSYSIFARIDLTENKIYSVSTATKNTLTELDDVINIKAYFSNSLPSQLLSLKREVEDVLDEYEAFSNGRIKIEYIDPGDDDKLKQELFMKGIPELTFEVVEKDKRQLQTGYMGITISYGDNREVIPTIKQNLSDLEYQLTSKIKRVTNEEVISVGFLSSQGARSLSESMKAVNQSLAELYAIREISLSEEEPSIDETIDTLVIVGPKEEFNEEQQKTINNFVRRGGALIALLDGVDIGEGLTVNPNSSKISTLLEKYGIKLNQDLVADQRSGMASFSQGFFSFSTPYPFWPRVTSEGFSDEYSAVSGLESVLLPWASSLSIDEEKLGDTQITRLMTSSAKAWTQSATFQIVPNQIPNPSGELGEKTLGVALNGFIEDPYAEEGADSNFEAKIIVISDSDFISDSFIGNDPDNLNLFLNLVDSVSLDDDLIKIRSKVATSRPIDQEDLDDGKKASLRYFNVFGMTVLVIGFGLVRYFGRRRSSFVDDL